MMVMEIVGEEILIVLDRLREGVGGVRQDREKVSLTWVCGKVFERLEFDGLEVEGIGWISL